MKNEYIAPQAEIVKINLTGSVLESVVGVNNGSETSTWEDAAAKKHHGFNDEEDEMPEGTADTHKSIWED